MGHRSLFSDRYEGVFDGQYFMKSIWKMMKNFFRLTPLIFWNQVTRDEKRSLGWLQQSAYIQQRRKIVMEVLRDSATVAHDPRYRCDTP